ncbi:Xylose import ATP-binding protein XylG [Neomoorella glycerini]|uniref:Xylose import ATP-binding protein XylG n=1 Tax=Neomoorella glycerini TaxID=55779 RepID=A0A6I5ZLY3_9FIRM|nr:xylose ABC transporter ATP-binding protein [Moorella glycerini]QGP90843.1 Xylose import ATP-binding protein XylG [Moorella glycerini]
MGEYIIEMRNISKSFPGVRALQDVNLLVKRGEIHGLCGENGAGKSTLMKILSGVYPYGSYEGEILIEGEVQQFHSVKDSEKAGIAIIYQELTLIKEMDVGENIFLGGEPNKKGVINYNELYHRAQKLLAEFHVDLNVHSKIKDLGIAQQQLVEIAKALLKNARILILDEPTAALTEKEIEQLMTILRNLKQKGVSCIYISHKLSEVKRITDRITVLRDGKTIATQDTKDLTEDKIIKMMVGRELTERFPKEKFNTGETVFEVKNLSVFDWEKNKPVVDNVSFRVRRGEILGIAGLMGAGRTELIMSIFGAIKGTKHGEIYLEGRRVRINSPADAIRLGLGLVSEDRKRFGLILQQSVQKNISLAGLNRIARYGIINSNEEFKACNEKVRELRIKTPSLETRVNNLSGGNQQKIILARWLLTNPRVLFLDEPTRGIDVGAKYEIYNIMNELVRKGVGIVMVSSELPEIMGMCDRILVMQKGRLVGEFMRDEATQEKIMACATGGYW